LDTKQADQFMGASHVSKYRKCRLCMELCISCFCTSGRPVRRTLTTILTLPFDSPLPLPSPTHKHCAPSAVSFTSILGLFFLPFFG
jgi:hypothetical protein